MNEYEKTIEELEEDLTEARKRLDFLQSFKESLEYTEKDSRYFYYNIKGTDLKVRIPCGNSFSVEIMVDKYYPTEEDAVDYAMSRYALEDSIRNQKINTYTAFLKTKSARKRAEIIMPNQISIVSLLIYLVKNRKGRFDRKIEKQLEKLIAEQKFTDEKKAMDAENTRLKYKKQTEEIDKYAALFLNWTGSVGVCEIAQKNNVNSSE